MSDDEGTQPEYVTKADLEEMISKIIKANPVHDDDEEEEVPSTGLDMGKTLREVEEWSKKLVEEAVNTLKKEMKATPKPKPTPKVEEDDTPKEPVGEQTPVTPGKKKWGERFWG